MISLQWKFQVQVNKYFTSTDLDLDSYILKDLRQLPMSYQTLAEIPGQLLSSTPSRRFRTFERYLLVYYMFLPLESNWDFDFLIRLNVFIKSASGTKNEKGDDIILLRITKIVRNDFNHLKASAFYTDIHFHTMVAAKRFFWWHWNTCQLIKAAL